MKVLAKVAILALRTPWAAVAKAPWKAPWTVPESDFGGAVPRNEANWLLATDYPMAAVRAGQGGYVTVSFAIGADGRMSDCKVIRSSGYAILDTVPCKVLPKRARFSPAKDANGAPVATRGHTSLSLWTWD